MNIQNDSRIYFGNACSAHLISSTSIFASCTDDELNLPRSPSFGKLLPSYKDKELGRNSLDSPELPCLKSEPWQKVQIDNH